MKYDAIIFDLDGTLLNTLEDLANSTNFALTSMGYPQRTIEEIRSFVGNGIEKLIRRALPAYCNEDDFQKALALFKSHYASHCEDNTKPYEGILNLLETLAVRGVCLAVVSNKIDSAVKILCSRFFENLIPIAIGAQEGISKKPSPDMIFSALKQLNISLDRTVYVGDSEVDILTAQKAGMDMICVTWGFRDQAFLQENGAKIFANSPQDLKNLLLL